jgi:hypothetical protein
MHYSYEIDVVDDPLIYQFLSTFSLIKHQVYVAIDRIGYTWILKYRNASESDVRRWR